MDILAETQSKIYGAITIDTPEGFASPFSGHLFPCLIWDHDSRFTDGERSALAGALLAAGCRYAVCAGESCQAWHDAIDMEFVQRHIDDSQQVQESVHVMTSSHERESPDDVAFFFVHNTNFAHHDFTRYLVLHIGKGGPKERLNLAVREYALNKRPPS
jgi:hypothetical protein